MKRMISYYLLTLADFSFIWTLWNHSISKYNSILSDAVHPDGGPTASADQTNPRLNSKSRFIRHTLASKLKFKGGAWNFNRRLFKTGHNCSKISGKSLVNHCKTTAKPLQNHYKATTKPLVLIFNVSSIKLNPPKITERNTVYTNIKLPYLWLRFSILYIGTTDK